MSLPSYMFDGDQAGILVGDQAGILVGMGVLETGGGGVVFRFSSGFWDAVGWEPLFILMCQVCSSLRDNV